MSFLLIDESFRVDKRFSAHWNIGLLTDCLCLLGCVRDADSEERGASGRWRCSSEVDGGQVCEGGRGETDG